jgi:hypothetical protein
MRPSRNRLLLPHSLSLVRQLRLNLRRLLILVRLLKLRRLVALVGLLTLPLLVKMVAGRRRAGLVGCPKGVAFYSRIV